MIRQNFKVKLANTLLVLTLSLIHIFRWLVVRVVADLGEQLAIHVGLFVDFRILLAGAVDKLQQSLGEACVQLVEHIIQAVADNIHCH